MREAQDRGVGGRRRERRRVRDRAGERAAAVRLAVLGHVRVVVQGALEHLVREPLRVVGAQQRPRRRGREGEVQQRLVALALHDLGRRAAGPDRLADADRRRMAAGVRSHEVAPGADDPARVAPERLHVGEADAPRVGPERHPQHACAGDGERDEDGGIGVHCVPYERDGPGQELLVTPVEERLVPVTRRVKLAHSRRRRVRRPAAGGNPSPVFAEHVHIARAERRHRARVGVVGVAPDAARVVREQVDRDRRLGRGRAHAVDVVGGRQQRVEVAGGERPALAQRDRVASRRSPRPGCRGRGRPGPRRGGRGPASASRRGPRARTASASGRRRGTAATARSRRPSRSRDRPPGSAPAARPDRRAGRRTRAGSRRRRPAGRRPARSPRARRR